MLVIVLTPVFTSASSDPARLTLPNDIQNDPDAAAALGGVLASVAERGLALAIETERRPYVSQSLARTALDAIEPAALVVTVATVTDTIRDSKGAIVDRATLVEVCSPVVLGADLVATLADDREMAPTVPSIIAAARAAGAELKLVDDDGSGMWAGSPDHGAVARARVGR